MKINKDNHETTRTCRKRLESIELEKRFVKLPLSRAMNKKKYLTTLTDET